MNELARRKHTIIAITHDPKIIKGAHGTVNLNAKPIPEVTFDPNKVPKADAKNSSPPETNEIDKDTAAQ
jgi:hypothetical protein